MSSIHALVASGSLLELQTLISYDKLAVNSRNQFLQTPLHIAAYDGNLAVADLLVLNGAGVNVQDKNKVRLRRWRALIADEWTPLHAAAHSGHLGLCRYLLDHGADPLLANEENSTAIHFLVRNELPKETGKREQFWDLLKRFQLARADLLDSPTDQGERPLHLAALRGQSQTVKFLLENGASIDALSGKGESAIFFAARMGHVNTFRLLLECGADLSIYGVHGSVLEVCSQSPHQAEIATAVSQLRGAAQMQSLTLQPLPNGPMGIAPRQRRWRHLKCLAARNLRPKNNTALVDIYFTLHDPSLPANAPPLFRSDVIQNTLNPTWESLSLGGVMPQHTDLTSGSTPAPPLPSSAYHLIVRLWCGTTNSTVMEFPLNLLHVGYISDIALSFPPDTLLLQLIDGWYTTADVMRALNVSVARPQPVIKPKVSKGAKEAISEPPRGREAPAHSYNRVMLGIIVALSKRAHEGRVRADALAKQIEEALPAQQQNLNPVCHEEATLMRITRLRVRIAEKEAQLKKEKELLQNMRTKMQGRVNGLMTANQALGAKTQGIHSRRQLLANGSGHLRQLGSSLDRWVTLLVGQIRDFFPIEVQGKMYSIAGLPLPNSDFTGCDEEKVANALSHVCTILLFLSDLFQVPLRYPIILLGSRSAIRDEVSAQAANRFPLYSRGVDRTRFEYGVFLLNKDLEQLMNARGIEVIDLKHTLPNLQTLLLSRSPYVAHLQRSMSGQNLKQLSQADDSRKKLDDQLRDLEVDIKNQERLLIQAQQDLVAFALDMGQLIRAQRDMETAQANIADLEKERQRVLGLIAQHAERERHEAMGGAPLGRSPAVSNAPQRLNSSGSSDF